MSVDGAEPFAPKYLSSKLSKEFAAEVAEADASLALVVAVAADVDASPALVDAVDALAAASLALVVAVAADVAALEQLLLI